VKQGLRNAGSSASCVRTLLIEQLDQSLSGLRNRGKSDAAVHQIRQGLKRARAGLRLIRAGLGKNAYRRENAVLRDAAQSLSEMRDATVLVRAFAASTGRVGNRDARAFEARLFTMLQRERRAAQRRVTRTSLAAATAHLQAARGRIAAASRAKLDGIDLAAGVERVYRRGREVLRRARREATDESLHECRKQAMYLANQADVLAQMNSRAAATMRKRSRRVSKWLGEDHDLAMLQRRILRTARLSGTAGDSVVMRAWVSRVARRRAALQRDALKLARRLYLDRPRQVAATIRKSLRAP